MKHKHLLLAAILLAPLATLHAAEPTHLRCEYLTNPLGIDAQKPRLSWIIEDGAQKAEVRGQKQTAYQVLVASTPDLLAKGQGDLWDSGKVMSDATSQIVYSGKPLPSRQPCFWKVKAWLAVGNITVESKPASWEMGLLKPEDWKAKWVEGTGYTTPPSLRIVRAIYGKNDYATDVTAKVTSLVKDNYLSVGVFTAALGCDPDPGKQKPLMIEYELAGQRFTENYGEYALVHIPELGGPSAYLRKTLKIMEKPVAKARLYVTALGLYEARLNGRRVGDVLFGPEWTDYKKRICYQAYDVTNLIRKGDNVLAALVGHGWYSGTLGNGSYRFYGVTPALLAQLEVTYTDGTVEQVVSDESWKQNVSPLLASDFMMGETYDARSEIKGWDAPGLDELAWKPVKVRTETARQLNSQVVQPVRQVLELKPKTITEPKPGCWTFDLGQNMVGFVRLKVSAPAGTKVTLRHAEALNPDGTVYTANLRSAVSIDTYICKGDGVEIFQPHFTFHGFRYIELTGLTEKPTLDNVTGVVVASDTPKTGEFSCSDPRINQLYSNIAWSQRGNYLSIPTDCPQRNERLGWTGDAQVFVRTATYNADVAAFFTKWLVDLVDAQIQEGGLKGAFPDIAPKTRGMLGTPAWADAGVICPWTIYWVYGDIRLLEQNYPAMVQWIEFCRSHSTNLIRDKDCGGNYADWLNIDAFSPKEIVGTAFFAYSTKLVAQSAKALGKMEDAAKYEQLFLDIKAVFNKKFVTPDGRIQATIIDGFGKTILAGNTQGCYVLALKFDLLPEELREKAAQYLADDIAAKKNHLSTGFIGTGHLLPVLSQAGKSDTAFKLLLQDTFPSWLFSVKHGATTIWERWNGWTPDKGFFHPDMNSFNHYSFGACGEWMFSTLAGIDTAGPGFKKVIIRPTPGEGITWVKASYDSINGRIVSNWATESGKLTMDVTIPPNTTATIYVPSKDAATVTESGKPATQAPCVKFLRQEKDRSIYEVGAGSYRFGCATK